jgi:hypothetical protein
VTPDPEVAYYQAVEEFFVSRRGDPLMLSNADWLLIRRWREQGLPLRIVLRGIADALDAHAHSWARRRRVGSLRYCEAEVDRARERWERALSEGGEPGADVCRSLEALARALGGAPLGPRARDVAARAAAELAQQRATRPRDVEPSLHAHESALVTAVRADAPALASEVERGVDAALESYRPRLPARVFASLREQSLRRELLARYGLPRLSLLEL